jgi:hypothetical protein
MMRAVRPLPAARAMRQRSSTTDGMGYCAPQHPWSRVEVNGDSGPSGTD